MSPERPPAPSSGVSPRRSRALCVAALLALSTPGCFVRTETPQSAPAGMAAGRAPPGFDDKRACGEWSEAAGDADFESDTHISFPELDPRSCFVRVHYESGRPRADPIPAGCGYPGDLVATTGRLLEQAATYQAIAAGRSVGKLPSAVACSLPDDVRRAAAITNGRTLRALALRLQNGRAYPYAASATFGFGHAAMGASALVGWLPGDECPSLSKPEMSLLSMNIVRAGRAAEAHLAGVAPVMTVSGGAVHSPLTEAFLLYYLATCRFGVQPDAVLLDPCADHTHTNLRNTGGLVTDLGGRTAYLVTDDGMQSAYLQEWTSLDLVGGSIDQRALRDWGHLLGSWRQASTGLDAGFWFTPYRFWAETRPGLGDFTCSR